MAPTGFISFHFDCVKFLESMRHAGLWRREPCFVLYTSRNGDTAPHKFIAVFGTHWKKHCIQKKYGSIIGLWIVSAGAHRVACVCIRLNNVLFFHSILYSISRTHLGQMTIVARRMPICFFFFFIKWINRIDSLWFTKARTKKCKWNHNHHQKEDREREKRTKQASNQETKRTLSR